MGSLQPLLGPQALSDLVLEGLMVHQVVEVVERAQRKTQVLSPMGAQRRKPDCPPGLPGRLPREVTLGLRLRGELPHCPQRGQRWTWQTEKRGQQDK